MLLLAENYVNARIMRFLFHLSAARDLTKRQIFLLKSIPARWPSTCVCCKKMTKIFATVSEIFFKDLAFAQKYMSSAFTFILTPAEQLVFLII